MSSSLCNNRGITLIESAIAILIVSIGLVGLMSMQPTALRTTVRTDYVGRAAMVLSQELNRQELYVMNLCNHPIPTGSVTTTVYASGQATAQAGDLQLTVKTTTTLLTTNVWRVTVQVSWPLNTTGIKESIVVTPQANFRFGCT